MESDKPSRPSSASAPPGRSAQADRAATQILILGVIATILVIVALYLARAIAVPTVMAVLAAIALAPLMRRIEKLRAPPTLAAAVIVFGILMSAAATIYALLPSADAWNDRAPQIIREMERRIRELNFSISEALTLPSEEDPAPNIVDPEPSPPVPAANAELEEEVKAEDPIDKLMDDGKRLAADWAISAPGMVAGAVYWAVLTFFLLRDREMLGRRLMAFGGGLSIRLALGRAMQDVQSNVATYLFAITLVNVALGLSVAGAFFLFGVPNAALWGVAAGVLNFMPFIGAAIMALITLAVGIVSFDDPLIAFSLVAVVVVLSSIEGQFITPIIVGVRIRLPSIAIFAAIAFGAWLWGAVGALVATPALIVANAFFTRLNSARRPTLPPVDQTRRRSRRG